MKIASAIALIVLSACAGPESAPPGVPSGVDRGGGGDALKVWSWHPRRLRHSKRSGFRGPTSP